MNHYVVPSTIESKKYVLLWRQIFGGSEMLFWTRVFSPVANSKFSHGEGPDCFFWKCCPRGGGANHIFLPKIVFFSSFNNFFSSFYWFDWLFFGSEGGFVPSTPLGHLLSYSLRPKEEKRMVSVFNSFNVDLKNVFFE